MGKSERRIFQAAAFLAVVTGCGALSSGRCISAFYAQTGRYSWLGIGISCMVFCLLTGGLLRLKRKTCAESLPELYVGVFGGKAGIVFIVLHAAFYGLCAYVLAGAAAAMARLILPLHRADIIGVIFALAAAKWLSGGDARIEKAGYICFMLVICLMIALLACGKAPGGKVLRFYVKLRLENGPWAAILLGLTHASLAVGISSAAAVRLYPANVKPGVAALVTTVAFGSILITGNLIFYSSNREINALAYPFVALASCWGKAGYYIFALLRYAESAISMCAIFCFLPGKPR